MKGGPKASGAEGPALRVAPRRQRGCRPKRALRGGGAVGEPQLERLRRAGQLAGLAGAELGSQSRPAALLRMFFEGTLLLLVLKGNPEQNLQPQNKNRHTHTQLFLSWQPWVRIKLLCLHQTEVPAPIRAAQLCPGVGLSHGAIPSGGFGGRGAFSSPWWALWPNLPHLKILSIQETATDDKIGS